MSLAAVVWKILLPGRSAFCTGRTVRPVSEEGSSGLGKALALWSVAFLGWRESIRRMSSRAILRSCKANGRVVRIGQAVWAASYFD